MISVLIFVSSFGAACAVQSQLGRELDHSAQPLIVAPEVWLPSRSSFHDALDRAAGTPTGVDGGSRGRRSRRRGGSQDTNDEVDDTAVATTGMVRVDPIQFAWYDPRGKVGRVVVLSSFAVVLVAILLWGHTAQNAAGDQHEDKMKRDNSSLIEDSYGFAVLSWIRDLHLITKEGRAKKLRLTRISSSIMLICFKIFLQVYIISEVQKFVTAKWIHDIRADYGAYEHHMYGEHTYMTENGRHRGLDGYLMPGMFDSIDGDLKDRVCAIPFSQQGFFLVVLFIWALSCIQEIRSSLHLFQVLIWNTETIESMRDALEKVESSEQTKVRGITGLLKVALMMFVILPRLGIILVLLWIGSFFLAATNDFSEMVLNAVALGFVVAIKDILYVTIVPDRNKREIKNIVLAPRRDTEGATYWKYLGSFKWAFIGFMWCVYYTFWLQDVLPDYKWDVKRICTNYLTARYAV